MTPASAGQCLRGRVRVILCCLLVFGLAWAFDAKCPKCGAENPDDAKFCGKCSEKLTREAYVPSVKGKDRNEAVRLLRAEGFRVRVEEVQSAEPAGVVLRQSRTGRTEVRRDAEPKITISVSAPPPEPKWLRKLKSPGGWPVEGKSVAGVAVGDSARTVVDTLGEPVAGDANSLGYQWGDDRLTVVTRNGRAETLAVDMSPAVAASMNQAIAAIVDISLKDQRPPTADSLNRAYPAHGITFLLRSDSVVGFRIYRPRRETRLVTVLRQSWTGLKSIFRRRDKAGGK